MMSDFQKAVSALRSLGISVEVINVGAGRAQIANIRGDGLAGSMQTVKEEDDQDE